MRKKPNSSWRETFSVYMNAEIKKIIWKKTGGRCHFCGKALIFSAKSGQRGRWHVDHILPKAQGGKNDIKNYIPICRACNRMRWYLSSKHIRKTFLYGVIAHHEVKKQTLIGQKLKGIFLRRKKRNKTRRK